LQQPSTFATFIYALFSNVKHCMGTSNLIHKGLVFHNLHNLQTDIRRVTVNLLK